MGKAREFLDFWTQSSVHGAEEYRSRGAEQQPAKLVERLLEMGEGEGLTRADFETEVGDLHAYVSAALKGANSTEADRRDRHQPN